MLLLSEKSSLMPWAALPATAFVCFCLFTSLFFHFSFPVINGSVLPPWWGWTYPGSPWHWSSSSEACASRTQRGRESSGDAGPGSAARCPLQSCAPAPQLSYDQGQCLFLTHCAANSGLSSRGLRTTSINSAEVVDSDFFICVFKQVRSDIHALHPISRRWCEL